MVYIATKVKIADKMDSMSPPQQATLRSLATFCSRPFYKPINSSNAEEIFEKSLNEIDAKLKLNESSQLAIEKVTLIHLQKKVKEEFNQSDTLPIELEFLVRKVSGSLVSIDDFSRIIFECVRDYKSLGLNDIEKAKVMQSLKDRLRYLVLIMEHLAEVKTDVEIERMMKEKKLDSKKLSVEYIESMKAVVESAFAEIEKMYEGSIFEALPTNLNEKSYDPGNAHYSNVYLMLAQRYEDSQKQRPLIH